MEITKREIISSIAIVCVMLILGIILSDKINDSLMEEFQEYNTALQIDNDSDLFQYGIRTNIGNAFVYGELRAVDPVSYPEIEGEYASMTKKTEKYTKHTRTVTKTKTVNGKTKTYTETKDYWTWDVIHTENKCATTISFLGVQFPYGTIDGFSESRLDTINTGYHLRDVYYGSEVSYIGTIYTSLGDNTISNCSLYHNYTIEETMKEKESKTPLMLFWFFWIILIGGCLQGFYYLDNKWLEN